MSKRKRSKYDEYFSISINNEYTCKSCTNYSKKKINVAKNGTNSLSGHLKTHHPDLYKKCEEKSKPKDDFEKAPTDELN